MTARPAAVAGMFYPAGRGVLQEAVSDLLTAVPPTTSPVPKALILPHAGYVYSGAIAASGYRAVQAAAEQITRVVLLGPAHRVYVQGVALPSVDEFETPLGNVALDKQALDALLSLPGVAVSDRAHAAEHCLEVHLPFLQTLLGEFSLVPVLVGDSPPEDVARLLQSLWGGAETLVVISSDLSHYHPYAEAQTIDAHTSAKIVDRAVDLTGEEACGAAAINGLMLTARARDLSVYTLDVRNSGDTAGDRSQVVGYGAYALA